MAKANKTATKPAAKKTAVPAPQQRVVRSAAATQVQQAAKPKTAAYRVLEPFWLGGTTIKPTTPNGDPVLIEMTAAEAEPYQDAGVLGAEPSEVPAVNTSEQSGRQDATNAGAPDSA
ncbi:MAG: hypothetical protein WA956_05600 [Stenotrophomonas sp.]